MKTDEQERSMSQSRYWDRHSLLAAITILLILGGCAAVGPDYVPPDSQPPSRWHTALDGGLMDNPTDRERLSEWWQTLHDPMLSRLIAQAVEGNLDLKEARARVQEARARRGMEEARFFPYVDASGKVTRSRGSEETGAGTERTLYRTGFDAGWEVDIFGQIRRSVEAADADLQAGEASLRDVLVTLTAEVALNYVDMRAYQTRLAVVEANLKAQEETYQLVRWRYEAGLSDALGVEQARYNMENTRSQIPTLRSGMEAALNRTAVLLGKQPGWLSEDLRGPGPIPVTPLEVAVGIPADCIRRRPDIRRVERELAGQTARIGVATADLYPKFSLAGTIGIESLSFGRLASSDGFTYSAGPTFSWRLFDAGAIRQNIRVQTALQEQALVRYESAVLKALEEVENALKAYAEEQRRRDALREACLAAQRAVELAQNQYEAGIIDFNEVLDAQRSLLSFEDQLAQSEGRVTTNLITLYKALGGGWSETVEKEQEVEGKIK